MTQRAHSTSNTNGQMPGNDLQGEGGGGAGLIPFYTPEWMEGGGGLGDVWGWQNNQCPVPCVSCDVLLLIEVI